MFIQLDYAENIVSVETLILNAELIWDKAGALDMFNRMGMVQHDDIMHPHSSQEDQHHLRKACFRWL